MSVTSSSSTTVGDEVFYRLGDDLRLAFDEAIIIVEQQPAFPITVKFFVAVVVGDRGYSIAPKAINLRRPDPEVMETLHMTIWDHICNKVPESVTVNFKIKDVRMSIATGTRKRRKVPCHFCGTQVIYLKQHMRNCSRVTGNFCSNCNAVITEDFLSHTLTCRTRKYPCPSCSTEFLNAASLRSHQRNCTARQVSLVCCVQAVID